ncbi:MAG: Fur family transcriptional regulator [Armatimonadota bacterium]|jgi:Fur family peroxide stress response transcriptional regulator
MSQVGCGDNAVEDRTRMIIRDLRSRGQRVTPQRVAIVREFVARCDHPSAEAIHRSLTDDFPMMALSTVYNTLRLLAEMGEAVEVSPATPETRFDPETGDHCHLTCLSCRRIDDLPLEACAQAREFIEAARAAGFKPVRQVYQIFGYCAECRGNNHDQAAT